MRFMFSTDLHLCNRFGRDGRYRRDCAGDLLAKLQFVIEEARSLDCHAMLFGGDWFDTPGQGYGLQQDLVDVLRTWPHLWFGVLGQHDVHGHDLESQRGSASSVFRTMENVIILHCERATTSDDSGQYVGVGGIGYVEDLLYHSGCLLDEDGGCPDITLLHALIGEPGGPEWFVDTSEIPKIGRLALCGDNHAGFPHFTHNAMRYVGPGALARTTPDESRRVPRCTFVEIEDDDVHHRHIDVPCKRPEDAFDLERWLDDVQHRETIEDRRTAFADALKSMGAEGDDVLDDIVSRVGVDHPRTVTSFALYHLQEARDGEGS